MINPEELAICRRRGHSLRFGKGWSQCKWCGLWLREQCTIEERADEPQPNQNDSQKQTENQVAYEQPLSPDELAICRRRGHGTQIGKRWSRCDSCGFWLRENLTIEEREDEPPEDEMSFETQAARQLAGMEERLKRWKELRDE
jgi:hypothetical protein